MIVDELGRIPMSPNLAAALQRASDYAAAQSHLEVTLEHLLLALTQDPDAGQVLQASNVDVGRLEADVSTHLGRIEERFGPGDHVRLSVSGELKRILEASAAAAAKGRRREINGAIVLAAIVGDARTIAAHMLRAQGLTFEEAIRVLRAPPSPPRAAPPPMQPPPMQPPSEPVSRPAPPPPFHREEPSTEDILASARERVHSRAHPPFHPHEPMAAEPPMPPPPVFEPEPSPQGGYEAEHDPAPVYETPHSFDPPPPAREAEPPPSFELPQFESHSEPDWRLPEEPATFGRPAHSTAPVAPPPQPAPPPPPRPAPHFEAQPLEPRWTPPPLPPSPAQAPPVPPLPPRATPMPAPMPTPQYAGGRDAAVHPPYAPPPPVQHRPPPPPPHFERPPQAPYPTRPVTPGATLPAPQPHTRQPAPPQQQREQPSPPPYAPWPEPPDDTRHPPPERAPAERRRAPSVEVESGQLVENVPRRMRVAVPVVVEARIAKASVKAIAGGMQGSVHHHDVAVTKAMSVKLRAPDGGFWIETASPETQWIENVSGLMSDDFASWRWSVTPRTRGRLRLQLVVSARTVGEDGLTAETALPDQIIDVRVGINYAQSARRWSGWALAAIAGGLLQHFGEGAIANGIKSLWSLVTG